MLYNSTPMSEEVHMFMSARQVRGCAVSFFRRVESPLINRCRLQVYEYEDGKIGPSRPIVLKTSPQRRPLSHGGCLPWEIDFLSPAKCSFLEADAGVATLVLHQALQTSQVDHRGRTSDLSRPPQRWRDFADALQSILLQAGTDGLET